jgi:membrane dipeptidase
LYGDHVGLHRVYAANLSLKESRGAGADADRSFEEVAWVEGLENPTEASQNILRWLVAHNYSDDEIAKVIGGNALRLLEAVWV